MVTKDFYGLDTAMHYPAYDKTKCWPLIRNLGVRWIRMEMEWRYKEPAKGEYDLYEFMQFDSIIETATKYGVNVMLHVTGTPAWATSGEEYRSPPDNPTDYADFCEYCVKRYPSVRHWEIWNEPNWPEFWIGTPEQYAEMLKVAYQRIKSVDPAPTVHLGGLEAANPSWMQTVYNAGAKPYFDVLNYHPYTNPRDGTPYLLMVLKNIRDIMIANGDEAKKVWVSEVGLGRQDFTEEERANWVRSFFSVVPSQAPYVEKVFWHNLYRGYDWMSNFAITDENYKPLPSYYAYQEIIGAAPPKPLIDLPTIGGLTLAIIDLALISYYIYTKVKGK